MPYTLRRIETQHCQLDLHFMPMEELPDVKDLHLWWINISMLIKMMENVNNLFIISSEVSKKGQIELLKQYFRNIVE